MAFYWYRDGTVTVTNGSTAVVGVDTLWATAVRDGDEFSLDGATWYEFNVVSDTSVTLNRAYAAATLGAQAYFMRRSSPERDAISNGSRDLADFTTTYRSLINVTASDRYFTLDKLLSTDNAGLWLKQGGASKFRAGLFGNNNYQIQYLVASTWTVAISVDPTTGAVSFGGGTSTSAGDFAGSAAAVSVFDNRVYAAGRGGSLLLQGYDNHSSPERTTWASLQGAGTDGTQASEDGDLLINTMRAGALTAAWKITNAADLLPAVTGVGNIGSATLMIGSVFLKSGSVINWNNGDVLLTHSANTLAFTGASSGYSFDALVSGTVLTLSSTITATGLATIGTAVVGYIHGAFGGHVFSGAMPSSGTGGIVNIMSTNTHAIDKGGQLAFGGYIDAQVDSNNFATIGGFKESGAQDENGGYFSIHTRQNGVGSSERVRVSSVGVVTITALATGSLTSVSGVITSSSDATLKSLVGSFDRGLQDLKKMDEPILYRWNKESGLDQEPLFAGWTAQGVRKGIPEAISVGPDGKLGLSDRPILAATVNAVIAMDQRIIALESRTIQ